MERLIKFEKQYLNENIGGYTYIDLAKEIQIYADFWNCSIKDLVRIIKYIEKPKYEVISKNYEI